MVQKPSETITHPCDICEKVCVYEAMKAKKTFMAAGIAVVICGAGGFIVLSVLGNRTSTAAKKAAAQLQTQAKELGLVQPISKILPQPNSQTIGQNALPIYAKIGPVSAKEITNQLTIADSNDSGRILQKTQKADGSASSRPGTKPRLLFGKLTDPVMVRVAQTCQPMVTQLVAASKMKYCLAQHDLSQPLFDVTFPSLAAVRQSSSLLAIDAEAAEISCDIGRARRDLLAITRIPTQLMQQPILISSLVAANIQKIAANAAFDGLVRHPNDPQWAKLSIEIDQQLPELPQYQAAPSEWMSASETADKLLSGKGSEIIDQQFYENKPTWLGSIKAFNFKANLLGEYGNIATSLLKHSLSMLQTDRLQFSNLDEAIKQNRALMVPINDSEAGQLAQALTFYGPLGDAKQWRIELSMLEASAQAVISRKGSVWPSLAVLPQPAFVPPSEPISTPAAAHPMNTVSLRGWAAGSQMEYKSSPSGFSLTVDLPDEGPSIKPIPADLSGGHKNAMRIVWKDGKLWSFNMM